MSLRQYFFLLRKDIALELRSREMLALLFLLALLLSVIVSSGLQNAGLPAESMQRLFAVLIWVVFLFNATLCIERSFDAERENGAMEGLLMLARVPAAVFYAAKLSSNFFIMMLGHLFSFVLLAGLMDVTIRGTFGVFFLISLCIVFAYSCAATLLAALVMSARLKGLLLPLILLPLLFPLFFAATEICLDLFAAGRFEWDSPWLSLALGLDVIYVLLGLNLFGFVLKE